MITMGDILGGLSGSLNKPIGGTISDPGGLGVNLAPKYTSGIGAVTYGDILKILSSNNSNLAGNAVSVGQQRGILPDVPEFKFDFVGSGQKEQTGVGDVLGILAALLL